jgi:hypothetical protein
MGPHPSTLGTFSLILKFPGHGCDTSYWKQGNMSIGLEHLACITFRRKRSEGRQTEFHLQSQAYFQKYSGKTCLGGLFSVF